jgi:2-oxoglutaroyl-CoA hydrolase
VEPRGAARTAEQTAYIPQQAGPAEEPETAAAPEREYHTGQFAFVEEPSDDSEDVIDWLKFTENRTERREEARRRARSRIIALVVVLAGAGGVFTAGGDIAGFLEANPEALSRLHWNVAAPERCPKPVIAKLRGYAFGVGLELALACDFRIAADDVQLALPEIKLGMIPGSGGTQRVARLIGLGRAKDLIMRGRRINGAEALSLGLVTEVVPPEELDAAADRLIDELLALSPLALGIAKRVLDEAYEGPLAHGLETEGLAYGLLRTTHDFREGIEAFLEKRPPRFEGR